MTDRTRPGAAAGLAARLLAALLLTLAGLLGTPSGALALTGETRPFSDSENLVLKAYIAYYGRPGDPSGMRYWSQRMEAEGGSLDSIIQAFGVSAEFDDRYGDLGEADLVNGLYQQLFGRDAEAGGLAFYVDLLQSGQATLQTIALNIIFGAINQDAVTVEHRMDVARYYLTRVEPLGDPPPDVPADDLTALLAPVSDDGATRDAGLVAVDALVAALPTFVHVFNVTKTDDTADGACNADCSLREAVIAANASPGLDLVKVPAGHYLLVLTGPSEESDQYRDLELRDDLHIQGAGSSRTLIDGGGWTRVLQVDTFNNGISATLTGLTIANGFHPFGGGIVNTGTLSLRDSVVADNLGYNGGGILNAGTLRLERTTLERNRAQAGQADTGYGGGLWNGAGASAQILRSTVRDNDADFNGGGINSHGTLDIQESVLSGNAAGAIGGAADSVGTLTVSGSTLSGNSANDGGAIATQGGTGMVSGSTFTANQATGTDLGGGGALFNYQAYLEVHDCLLEANTALGEGGGAIETNGNLLVRNSILRGNQAVYHTGHSLPGDTSPGFGGAILTIAGSQVQLENSQLTGNRAGVSGGGIYNDRNTQLTLSGVLVDGNVAERNYGGGINSEGNMTLAGVTVSNNQSTVHGGGITSNLGTVTLTDSAITGNQSRSGGGIGNFIGGQMRLERSRVEGNRATGDGTSSTGFGGGLLNDEGHIDIVDSLVASNQAVFGGGLSVNHPLGVVAVDRSTFELNVAPDGPALVNFGSVFVRDSRFAGGCNNHATLVDQGGNTAFCN